MKAPDLRITETSSELCIQVHRDAVWGETCLRAVPTGAFVYFVAHATVHLSSTASVWVGLLAVVVCATLVHRPVDITTTVTKFEAHVVGRFGGGYDPLRHIPLADTTSLEYRESGGGGDDAYQPEGLYVETRWYSVCLVPFVSEPESAEIRDLLHRHFPHIAQAPYTTGIALFQDDLVRLNLSQPQPIPTDASRKDVPQ